ncbi:MAG: hypothetical protein HY862_00045 [Chloroflexi bacterium]|nr:hypothetical protein [Chloroflexota bacterium]
MLKHFGLVCLVFCLTVGWHQNSHAQDGPIEKLTYDGLERTVYIHVPPSYSESQPVPLVLVLHPFASSGKAMAALTGFDAAADEQGFIVAYPDSANLRWDDGRSTYAPSPGIESVDDLGFITHLIDELTTTYAIDSQQIYLVGSGAGGLMAYRLACEYPERFAKVVVASALIWNYHEDLCPSAAPAPISMLIVVGSNDFYYPLEGRNVEARDPAVTLRVQSMGGTLRFWGERNDCDLNDFEIFTEPAIRLYQNCNNESSLAFLSIENAGNNWLRSTINYQLNQFGVDYTEIATRYLFGPKDGEDWQGLVTKMTTEAVSPETLARNYAVYVPPSYDPTQPTPVVMALHGRPDTGTGMAYLLDLNRVAQTENFIAVYPDGINQGWNYTLGFPGYGDNDINDVEFLGTLIKDLSLDLNIDSQRVYLTGFSNGGFMTQAMACEAADQFAAFAVIGATAFPGFETFCAGTPPIPMLFIHGSLDKSIPWDGLQQSGQWVTYPVSESLAFWAVHNNCDPNQVSQTDLPASGNSPGTSVTVFEFKGCAEDDNILFYEIDGGGHNIPGVPGRLDAEQFGAVNMDIDAPTIIWEFLSQHTLDPLP